MRVAWGERRTEFTSEKMSTPEDPKGAATEDGSAARLNLRAKDPTPGQARSLAGEG